MEGGISIKTFFEALKLAEFEEFAKGRFESLQKKEEVEYFE